MAFLIYSYLLLWEDSIDRLSLTRVVLDEIEVLFLQIRHADWEIFAKTRDELNLCT